MAIQVRRGLKADFDPNKLLPGEFAAPLDTKELYLAYGAGDVKRMSTYEDMQDNISEVTQDIVDDLTTEVKIATTNANTKATYAQAKGDYAKEQGDYAKTKGQEAQSVIDSAAPILNQNLQATYSDKGTVTGKFINFQFADDAMAQVNIKGKSTQVQTIASTNLFNIYQKYTKSQTDITVDITSDGTITIHSDAPKTYSNITFHLKPEDFRGKTFTFARESITSIPSGVGAIGIQLTYMVGSTPSYFQLVSSGTTIAIPDNIDYIRIGIYLNNSPTELSEPRTTIVSKIQINEGSTKLPYVPFVPNSPSPDYPSPIVSAQNFDLVSTAKNILPKWNDYTETKNGVTITVKDNVYSLNGTATARTAFYFKNTSNANDILFYLNGIYAISLMNSARKNVSLRLIRDVNSFNPFRDINMNQSENLELTTENFNNIPIRNYAIRIESGTELVNFTFKPQIELGSVATIYTPYKEDRINIPYDMGEWNEIKDNQYIKGGKEVTFVGDINEIWEYQGVRNGYAKFNIGKIADYKHIGVTGYLCNIFISYSSVATLDSEGIAFNAYQSMWVSIKIDRLVGWSDSLTTVQKIGLFRTFLQSTPMTVRYSVLTPTITPLNTYLKTFKGTTNIYTTAIPQVELTATFKSQLWADSYLKENAIESKFDTNKIINSDNVTEPGFVPDARRVKAARDDITILQSTLSNTVSVKNYGAVGNGLANDTLAFQKALSYLENGGVLYIPSGTYLIHEILYVPSNVKVIGLGDAILKRNANINAIMLTKVSGNPTGYSGAYNITIENIIFDGSQSAFTPQCTLFGTGHATNINVQNCTFKNLDAWHMVEFNSTKDSKIYGCVFDTYGYNGTAYSEMIQLDYAGGTSVFPWYGTYDDTQCKNIKITNNIFRNCKGSAIGNHSFKSGVLLKDIYVQNNIFESIENSCLSLCDVENYYISNNTFINIRYAIILTNQANNNTNIIIDNNSYTGTYSVPYVSNEGRFIGINPTGRNGYITSKVKITNNIIKKANLHGIGLTANDVIINGNVITNCYLNGIYFYGGSNCVISANTVSDNNIASQAGRSDVVVGNNSNDVTENLTFTGNNVYSFIAGTNTSKILLISNNIATLIRGNAILEDNIIGNALDGESTTLKTVTAVSTYGTLASGGYIKTGKIITVNLSVNITTEVPALTSFITGLPVGLVNLTALAGFKTSGAVLNGFYVAVDTIRCASILPVGNYTISGTYLTY